MDVIEREVIVPASPAEVWPALARSEEISAWFGADADIEVSPGGRGVFRWPDGSERHAVVEEVEPERWFSFRWLPFRRTADGAIAVVPATRVAIALEEVPGGTLVRVVEQPAFPGGRPSWPSTRGVLAAIGS